MNMRSVKHYLTKIKVCLKIIFFRDRKMVFLLGSPYHPNMGDHAQTYCILEWYKKNFPEYGILILRSTEASPLVIKILRRFIRKEDKIVCHSGYQLTDLYDEQRLFFRAISLFKDYPIVIFPNTIYYSTNEALDKAKDVINSHPDLTIMCRDENSYEIARKHFNHARLMLYPDIVTSMIGMRTYSNERDGILFCMRNDIEAYYKPDQIAKLRSHFEGYKTGLTDTDRFDFSMKYLYAHRGEALDRVLDEMSHYKVIITDRYHGTIFSLVTGTPVIVLGTTDHKLKSGVKWFPKDLFGDYVFYANDLEEAYDLTMNVLNHYDKINHKLPAYFKEKYYDTLKETLSNIKN